LFYQLHWAQEDKIAGPSQGSPINPGDIYGMVNIVGKQSLLVFMLEDY
jgi:hypothetical protein